MYLTFTNVFVLLLVGNSSQIFVYYTMKIEDWYLIHMFIKFMVIILWCSTEFTLLCYIITMLWWNVTDVSKNDINQMK